MNVLLRPKPPRFDPNRRNKDKMDQQPQKLGDRVTIIGILHFDDGPIHFSATLRRKLQGDGPNWRGEVDRWNENSAKASRPFQPLSVIKPDPANAALSFCLQAGEARNYYRFDLGWIGKDEWMGTCTIDGDPTPRLAACVTVCLPDTMLDPEQIKELMPARDVGRTG